MVTIDKIEESVFNLNVWTRRNLAFEVLLILIATVSVIGIASSQSQLVDDKSPFAKIQEFAPFPTRQGFAYKSVNIVETKGATSRGMNRTC